MEIQPGNRRAYALAGQAILTLEGKRTRFTYRIVSVKGSPAGRATHWVHVLNGPDNERNYRFFGALYPDGFFGHSQKSPIAKDAPSVQAFAWFWRHLESPEVKVFHAGTCGRCGRTLTTPESIRTGLGPVCSARQ